MAPSSLGVSAATLPTGTTNVNVVSSTGKSKASIAVSTSTGVNAVVNTVVNTSSSTTATTAKRRVPEMLAKRFQTKSDAWDHFTEDQMTTMKSSEGKQSYLVDSERATTSVSRWFACSASFVPLRMLDNTCFMSVSKEQVPTRFHSKHPKLSQAGAKKCVDAEHELMKKEIKKVIAEKLEDSKGVPFG